MAQSTQLVRQPRVSRQRSVRMGGGRRFGPSAGDGGGGDNSGGVDFGGVDVDIHIHIVASFDGCCGFGVQGLGFRV